MADVEAGQPAAGAAAPKQKKPSVSDWSKSKLLRTLRLMNMCNGLGLITAGILVFLVEALSINFTTVSGRVPRGSITDDAALRRAFLGEVWSLYAF